MKRFLCLIACITSIFCLTACIKGDENTEPQAQTVSITLDLDGGAITGSQTITATVGKDLVIEAPTKTGYNFVGWQYNGNSVTLTPFNLTESAVTLKAIWELKTYQVTLDFNGGVINEGGSDLTSKQISVSYGGALSLPTPTKTGYEFGGYTLNGQPISATWSYDVSDATLVAVWNAKTVEYQLVAEGATLSSNAGSITFGVSTQTIKDIVPLKVGYNFDGWFVDGQALSETFDYYSETAVVITASFSAKTYQVRLDVDGGELPSEVSDTLSIDYDASTQTIKDIVPVKDNYAFVCWTVNGQEITDVWQYDSEEEIVVTASYDEMVCQVTLDVDGGELPSGAVSSYTVSVGSSTQSLKDITPTKTGYNFAGWEVDGEELKDTWDYQDEEITVLATWQAKNINYVLVAEGVDLQTNTGKIDYDSSTDFIKAILPSKTGYDFECWLVDGEELLDSWLYDGETITVTAKFKAKTYSVILDLNGGVTENEISVNLSIDYDSSTQVVKDIQPSKKGYDFAGWFIGNNELGDVWCYDNQNATTITAKYQPKTLNYVFSVEGGTVSSSGGEILYDSSTDAIKAIVPSKRGYDFVCWLVDGEELLDSWLYDGETVTVTALFEPKTIEYVLVVNGGNLSTTSGTILYGSATEGINALIPEKTGYNFRAWTVNGQELGANFNYVGDNNQAVVLVAEYTAKTYAITLSAGNGTLPSGAQTELQLTYDQSGTLPVPTSNDNALHFIGWKIKNSNNYVSDIDGNYTWKYDYTGEIVADYSENEVIIFRHYDGETEKLIIPYGGTIGDQTVIPTPKSKNGYDVSWDKTEAEIREFTVTTEVNVVTVAKKCTVKFNHFDNSSPAGYTFDAIVKLPTFAYEGYDLLGWSLSETDKTNYLSGTIVWQYYGSITLYGVYQPKEYTVTYDLSNVNENYYEIKDVGGNSTTSTQTVIYKQEYHLYNLEVIDQLATVTWLYNGEEFNVEGVWDFTNGVTLTPKFTYADVTYNLNIDVNGGTGSDTATIKLGSKLYDISQKPTAPQGKKLIGYTYNNKLYKLNDIFDILDYDNDSEALVAKYVDIVVKTINIDVNGGTGSITSEIEIGELFSTMQSKPKAPEGKKLSGFSYKGQFYSINSVFDVTDYDGTLFIAQYVDDDSWTRPA